MMTVEEARLARAKIEQFSASLTDADASTVAWMFPRWVPGTSYAAGIRLCCGGGLYRVRTAHISQADWLPPDTPALYERVASPDEDGAQTPIGYAAGMALEAGKRYTQDGTLYLCVRDTGIPVYNDLADLVGLYVEVVNDGT